MNQVNIKRVVLKIQGPAKKPSIFQEVKNLFYFLLLNIVPFSII